MYKILSNIDSPTDLKKLSINELNKLASEIREALFFKTTKVGGHLGPNFGIVETILALHYVFDSPIDKIIFDVSHQTYTHKILTGRKLSFIDEKYLKLDSGYSNCNESLYDLFNIGHTSTSISLATGIAKARDLQHKNFNVVALIGDGSLSGGEALEGLNVAGYEINSNLIILVNDNQQSISETYGGLYKNLKELRNSKGKCKNNIFKSFGLDYIYEDNGNDVNAMIKLFKKLKDIDHPIVAHINTTKGKGYKIAEENKEQWHYTNPFDINTGKRYYDRFEKESYQTIARDFIIKKAKKDKTFAVITPNMPTCIGLSKEYREILGNQYIDVGIAEEHAVAMASGMAKQGAHPLVITNMTFMQRTYDQVSHDICLNNSPVTILVNSTSISSSSDASHLGIFGISLFSSIPNLIILAPTCKKELLDFLEWSTSQNNYPVMILLPANQVDNRDCDTSINNINSFHTEIDGKQIAIIALGDFFQKGLDLHNLIKTKLGINSTLINPRFANGLDINLLEKLKDNHNLIITLEDGILDGGFGQKIASYYGLSNMKVKNYGFDKYFYNKFSTQELFKNLFLTNEHILKDIKELYNKKTLIKN